jgi:hypothetical protein
LIPVIYKKPNFLDTLKYVLGKEDAVIVDTNMMGTSPNSFNEQFLITKYTNKAVKRQCAHLIIAIAHRPDYHEHLSDSQYSYVAREFLTDMGYLPKDEAPHATSQFVAVRHHDRSHEHLHIIASRIRLDGSLVNDSYDYFNSQVSTRQIAAQLGLEVTPTTNEAVAYRLKTMYGIVASTSPNRSKSIRAVNSKHKTPTSKEIIRSSIGEAIKDSPTVSTFIQRLEENNIGVLPKMRGDELLGFTYIHNDVKIAGYQIYKLYSWNKLQSEYGVKYEKQRDIGALEQARVRVIARRKDNQLSLTEDFIFDKSTTSTTDSSGNTNSNISLSINTDILNKSGLDENLTVENTLREATGKGKKKVQQNQLIPAEEQPQVELLPTVSQNVPFETKVVEELSQGESSEEKQLSAGGLDQAIASGIGFRAIANSTEEEHYPLTQSSQQNQEEILMPSLQGGEDESEDCTPTQSLYYEREKQLEVSVTQKPVAEQVPIEQSPREKALLASAICHLPSVITDYMLVTNNYHINGRELSAFLVKNILTVCRHGHDAPVMQVRYHDDGWYEEIQTQLTTNEIEQIESLRFFTQQALMNISRSERRGIGLKRNQSEQTGIN